LKNPVNFLSVHIAIFCTDSVLFSGCKASFEEDDMKRQHFTYWLVFLGFALVGTVFAQTIDFTPAMTPAAATACNAARGIRTLLGPSLCAIALVIGIVMVGQKNSNGWIWIGSAVLGGIFLFVMPQVFGPILPGCAL
jgi:hypothetical protein